MSTVSSVGPPPRRYGAGKVAAVVVGSLLSIVAIGLIAAGGFFVWGNSHKDRDGYLATGSHRFVSSGYAIATDDLDLDINGPDWVAGDDVLGKIRLKATSRSDQPVFVGVARTQDVTRYLRGADHSVLTDVDLGPTPFEPTYRNEAGSSRPAAPASQSFWAAQASGTGTQTASWKVRGGNWSVVVMNADGSRGVDAGVSAGARLTFIGPLGWSLVGSGAVLLALAGALIYVGARAPRGRTGVAAPESLAVV